MPNSKYLNIRSVRDLLPGRSFYLRALLIVLFISLFQNRSLSQIAQDSLISNFYGFSQIYTPEKLFIHTDKSLYVAGETIWFKGYLENSSYINSTEDSRFIYVELYKKDSLIHRVKIKHSDNGFPGYIETLHTLTSGKYTLRAYTSWMRNFEPEFMFYKTVEIFNPFLSATKKVADISPDSIASVMFFPESGLLIQDNFSVIAFKATNAYGRGVSATGTVYNSKDSVISSFRTEHNGMGTIRLFCAQGESYYVLINDSTGIFFRADLPRPSETGAVINVTKKDDNVFINTKVSSTHLKQGANLIIHDGSEILMFVNISDYTERLFVIKEEALSEGINHVIIMDNFANIAAERLFFKFPAKTSKILLSSSNPDMEYTPGESAEINLSVSDALGNPVQGEFSVSVTDSFLVPFNYDSDNLVSYMLLSSQLEGYIEFPAQYFRSDFDNRERAMDLLMMVHGWRYYDLPSVFKSGLLSVKYPKEVTQTISGRASSNFRNTKRAIISVYAPEINLAESAKLNRDGYFYITDLDFPDSTYFLISCTGREGQRNYYLEIDNQQFPSLHNYKTPYGISSVAGRKKPAYEQLFIDTGGASAFTLESAKITAEPTLKYNPSPFGQRFDKRQIRQQEDLDLYTGTSLLDYVVLTFPGLQYGTSEEDGRRTITSTRSSSITGEPGTPLLYLNRLQVQSTADLDNYTIDDVENVAFLKGNDGFLFRTLWGVILVTLKYGHASMPNKSYNSMIVTHLGWQKPAQFYSDHQARTTLYWNPSVKTDSEGNTSVVFNNSNRNTRYNISIEGYSISGERISVSR